MSEYRLEDQSYFLEHKRDGTFWQWGERSVIFESDDLEEVVHFRRTLPPTQNHDYFIYAETDDDVLDKYYGMLKKAKAC